MFDKDKGFKDFAKIARELNKKSLKLGIFSDAGKNRETGQYISEYASYNEHGTKKIPKRPFLSTTFDEHKDEWLNDASKLLASTDMNAKQIVRTVGEKAVGQIKETISSNIDPRNAASTIAKKKSSRTLIDTGAMRAAVSYKVSDV